MRDDSCLRANDRDVAAKVVDGEAILIHLTSGLYYSMDKVGAHVWSILAAGSSVERIAALVSERYGVPVAQATSDVRQLVRELLDEGLIVLGDGEPPALTEAYGAEEPTPYEAPKLVKYDDMADMFALDPPLPELPAVSTDGRS